MWQKHRVRHQWPTSRTYCSFVLIRHAGPLVRIACLPSFSLLAYLSYTFHICSHSPLPTAHTRYSSALTLLVGQHLVPVARRPSFSTLAYCSYAFRVCSLSPLPTARMHYSSALILLAGLHLVRVAHLPLCAAVCIRKKLRNYPFTSVRTTCVGSFASICSSGKDSESYRSNHPLTEARKARKASKATDAPTILPTQPPTLPTQPPTLPTQPPPYGS